MFFNTYAFALFAAVFSGLMLIRLLSGSCLFQIK